MLLKEFVFSLLHQEYAYLQKENHNTNVCQTIYVTVIKFLKIQQRLKIWTQTPLNCLH